jgi:pimeloyl-ACP methyl ester carboxylesterase
MTTPGKPVHVEPMTVGFDPAVIDDLHERLRRTRRVPVADDDWARGVATSWLTGLLRDWQEFDVTAFERRLAAFTHQRVDVDGQSVHVIVADGQGPRPLPLLLTNGWPSSFCEYLELIPLLADPAAYGGDPNDAFTVVVPSLPGFGFSAPPPPDGFDPATMAQLWNDLMTAGFGHPRYVAHGSDIGGRVAGQLGRAYPGSVAAIHLATPGLPVPPKPWTPAEQAYAAEFEAWLGEEGSYAHQHSTKPATLGAALQDSPAGLAAWIGEKLVAWSSLTEDGETAFARDLLLATLTIYWATGTITSSMLSYWNYRHTAGAALTADEQSPVPTTISIFGGERVAFPKPTREIAERFFNVVGWHEHDRGGHFPAAAEPVLLAETLRDAFRPLR